MNDDEKSPWEYKPEGDDNEVEDDGLMPETAGRPSPASRSGAVSWQAVEFIQHPHNSSWYGALVFLTAALTAFVYFITKDYIATATIPIVGVIVGVFAGHKPQVVHYEIASSGLKIGEKSYPYKLFKSFSILQEGDLNSVNLFPLKRFMPPIAAYFEAAEQDKIVNALGEYLPFEERKMDSIDRLSRRLRL